MSISRLYPGKKLLFEQKNTGKKLFLSTGHSWDSGPCLRHMEQKYKLGGTIG